MKRNKNIIFVVSGTYFTILISQGLFNKEKPTNVSKGLFFSIINMIGMAYLQKSDREALIHMVMAKIVNLILHLTYNY